MMGQSEMEFFHIELFFQRRISLQFELFEIVQNLPFVVNNNIDRNFFL